MPIALMTDFGSRDPYVGIMKGVILGINPSAVLVDVCHDLDLGDVKSASFALSLAFPYFPAGTIYVVVVDPEVGSGRRALAVSVEDKFIVCPDNGILSWILRRHQLSVAVETEEEYCLPHISHTFHGRDVFSAVAAHLSNGLSLSKLGRTADDLVVLPLPEVIRRDKRIEGEVIYIDRFGNLITNITSDDLAQLPDPASARVNIGSIEIPGVRRTYADAVRGYAVAVLGSSGFLEIAVNGGSAAQSLGSSIGSHVLIYGI